MEHLAGLIWTFMLGIAAGNYACSLIYRLPINEPLFEKHPFCGSCKTFLKPKDLFPLFSWLLLKGKCRYCTAPIPAVYTVTEIAYALIFCLGYLRFGFSEPYILFLLVSSFVIILAAIAYKKSYLDNRLLLAVAAFAFAHRILADATIYGYAGGVFAGGMVSLSIWRLIILIKKKEIPLPSEVFLLSLAGGILGFKGFVLFLLPFAVGYLLIRFSCKTDAIRHITALWALCTILMLLYAQSSVST